MALALKIVSPEKVVYDGEVTSVVVPGISGQFEILVNHAPIISALEVGEVVYVVDGRKESLHVSGGFVSVQKNVVNVCVEV